MYDVQWLRSTVSVRCTAVKPPPVLASGRLPALPDEGTQEWRRPPLSRERIVWTALAIVDADGLDGLTMRRLGKDLDVTTMAVYHHFPNKSALYDGIVEAVMAEIDVSAAAV